MPDNAGQPGANPGQGNGDEPKYVTVDQLNEAMNRAITGRLKDFGTKVQKDLETTLATFGDGLIEKIKTEPTQKQQQQPQPQGGEPGKIDDHPTVKGLMKRLDEETKKISKIEAERDAEKQRSKDVTLRSSVSDALAKTGIGSAQLKHAVGHLVDAEKLVRWGEDGESLVFRDSDGEEVDLETGLKGWLKSDDAKIYLPPRGTQGSGARPGGSGAPPAQGGGNIGERLAEFFLGD